MYELSLKAEFIIEALKVRDFTFILYTYKVPQIFVFCRQVLNVSQVINNAFNLQTNENDITCKTE